MNLLSFLVLCLVLCVAVDASTENANLNNVHHLIKRQAQNADSHSGQYASSTRRPFVSPYGEPYYEYQPPVSSGRGSSSSGRSATSQVSIGGVPSGRQATSQVAIGGVPSGRQATSQENFGGPRNSAANPPTLSGSRGRTYRYPFGRERVQYSDSPSQGSWNQTYGSSDTTNGNNRSDWQKQEAELRQQRQNSLQSSNNLRSAVNYKNDSAQTASNQQSSYDATALQEQEIRRRQDELRRRHEGERRRQEEERRRLIEERRRQEEDRRRQYYEQQQRLNQQQKQGTENNRNLQPNVTRSQQSILPDSRRQEQQQSRGTENNRNLQPNVTRSQQPVLPDSRQQQHQQQQEQQQQQQQQPSSTSFTQQRAVPPDPSSQQYTPITAQQGQQYPTINQQARPSSNSQQTSGSVPRYQQPVNSFQRTYASQQPAHRTNSTHFLSPQATHNQQPGSSQVFYQQPGQVDPRFQTSQRVNFTDFRSNNEPLSQGPGQSYPYQAPRGNFGSSFSYLQQDNDNDCPETGIDLRINGLDCQQAIQQYGSYLCYTHEYTSRDCCQVCKPRKQPSRTGCEYGDHAELCTSIAPADCYDLRNKFSCCETCERLRRSNLPAGCEYGDMTVRCENVRQNPGLCYIPDNQRLCCETCSQIRNVTNPGCPWGDYNPNLCQLFEENTANVRINCYSQQRRRLCCQSCERLREWMSRDLPTDCQYGDRPVIFTTSQFGQLNCSNLFSYFSVDECRTNEAVATNCCQTCHRLLNSRG